MGNKLIPVLSNANLLGVSLVDADLADKVTGYFKELIACPGTVRAALKNT